LLRQIEVAIANGKTTHRKPARKRKSPCRPSTAGGREFGGLKLDQPKRPKESKKENSKLKRLVAELFLEKQVLKNIAEGTSKPRAASDDS
jgi:putative transposase